MVTGLYFELNAICIFILIISIWRIVKKEFSRKTHKLLILTLSMYVMVTICDSLWALLDGNIIPSSRSINYAVNIAYFIFTSLSVYFWFLYCTSIQKSALYKRKFLIFIMSVPALFLIICSLFTPVTGWIFSIDSTGAYQRGSLYIIQVIVTLCYMFTASLISWISVFNKKQVLYRSIYVTCGFFFIFAMVSVILQLKFPGYPVNSIGFTLPVLILVLKISDFEIDVDDLTLLYNRNWLYKNYKKIETLFNSSTITLTNPSYLIFMDIDHLDDLNRTYGRETGNQVLLQITDILNEVSSEFESRSSIVPIRYGGDEFMLICSLESAKDIASLINLIKVKVRKLSDTKINGFVFSLSFGYTEINFENSNIIDDIAAADLDMYREKKNKRYKNNKQFTF